MQRKNCCKKESVMSQGKNYQKIGETVYTKVEKINAEIFTLTYGSIVCQLLSDTETVEEVNTILDRMGYNIGIRLIDEFLAKSGVGRCIDFRETADVIAIVGFKMFLGVTAVVGKYDPQKEKFSIILEENPLIDYVELPTQYKETLIYSNILCGVIRGALEMLQLNVSCKVKQCPLRGQDVTEIRVKLIERLTTELPVGEG